MIDSTTNIVEHPDLVAERLVRYAGVVGKERLIGGVDCGFGTVAQMAQVHPGLVWLKLGPLVEEMKRASAELWA